MNEFFADFIADWITGNAPEATVKRVLPRGLTRDDFAEMRHDALNLIDGFEDAFFESHGEGSHPSDELPI